MARWGKGRDKQSGNDPVILTLTLVGSGFVLFYYVSQAATPADAHLIHWGAAALGAILGWLVGLFVERVRG